MNRLRAIVQSTVGAFGLSVIMFGIGAEGGVTVSDSFGWLKIGPTLLHSTALVGGQDINCDCKAVTPQFCPPRPMQNCQTQYDECYALENFTFSLCDCMGGADDCHGDNTQCFDRPNDTCFETDCRES